MLALLTYWSRNMPMEPLRDARPLLDEQFEALAHVERRRLLVALLGNGSEIEAPFEIGGWRAAAESSESRVELVHNHLPKLEDFGLVRWDEENALVAKGPEFENIEPIVVALDEHRDELPDDLL